MITWNRSSLYIFWSIGYYVNIKVQEREKKKIISISWTVFLIAFSFNFQDKLINYLSFRLIVAKALVNMYMCLLAKDQWCLGNCDLEVFSIKSINYETKSLLLFHVNMASIITNLEELSKLLWLIDLFLFCYHLSCMKWAFESEFYLGIYVFSYSKSFRFLYHCTNGQWKQQCFEAFQ